MVTAELLINQTPKWKESGKMDGTFQIQDDPILLYVGKTPLSVTAITNDYLKILLYVF